MIASMNGAIRGFPPSGAYIWWTLKSSLEPVQVSNSGEPLCFQERLASCSGTSELWNAWWKTTGALAHTIASVHHTFHWTIGTVIYVIYPNLFPMCSDVYWSLPSKVESVDVKGTSKSGERNTNCQWHGRWHLQCFTHVVPLSCVMTCCRWGVSISLEKSE